MWDKDKGGDNLKIVKKLTTAEPTATPAAVEAMFAIRPGCRGWAGATMGGGGGGAVRAGGLK